LKIKTSNGNPKQGSPRDKVLDYYIYKKTTDNIAETKDNIQERMQSLTTFNSNSTSGKII